HHHPRAVSPRDPEGARGGRVDRRRGPPRLLLSHGRAAQHAGRRDRGDPGLRHHLERIHAAAVHPERHEPVHAAPRRAELRVAVLGRHRPRARLHLAVHAARAHLLQPLREAHRRRPHGGGEGMTAPATVAVRAVPATSDRVRALLSQMTLEAKTAQLVGYWLDHGHEVVAPMADEMDAGHGSGALAAITRDGIGHFTRVYGTRPVDPAERAAWLREEQRRLVRETRLGIPALVHEECLPGLAAWKAATFPTPLAWGAAFDPDLVEEMAAAIGDSMRELGVHQGLAPVLDVVRDPRWGRADECIAEDPYVVGTVGTAFVRGIQSAGVHATLKHFLAYSGSQAGRNHAPVHAGPREIADVFLPPFEMAIRDGGARSVMNSYAEIDGVPVASDPRLLTDLLRGELGFDGTVVAD